MESSNEEVLDSFAKQTLTRSSASRTAIETQSGKASPADYLGVHSKINRR